MSARKVFRLPAGGALPRPYGFVFWASDRINGSPVRNSGARFVFRLWICGMFRKLKQSVMAKLYKINISIIFKR